MTLTPEDIARLKELHRTVYTQPMTTEFPSLVTSEYVTLIKRHLDSLLAAAERCGELEKKVEQLTKLSEAKQQVIDAHFAAYEASTRLMDHKDKKIEIIEAMLSQAETRVRELEGENEQLTENLEYANHLLVSSRHDKTLGEMGDLAKSVAGMTDARITGLTTRLAAARTGLEWYADKQNYAWRPYGTVLCERVVVDAGKIARDTLARIGGEA